MDAQVKLDRLKEHLKSLGSAAVAFSGGVDSSFLIKTAFDVLGENALGITARSAAFPEREFNEAVDFAKKYGIRHQVIVSEELEVPGFAQNPANRCYLCKHELFSKIIDIAHKENIKYVLEGSNHDDISDYRPGLQAINELSVISPLREAELTKDEIRFFSKEMGLSTWDKPSFACLSSRFPYGHTITVEKLQMVDKAEQYLIDLGFKQVRVRHHGDIARIELSPSEIGRVINDNLGEKIYTYFKKLGFSYSALDLKGYRTGSMNETL